MLTLGGRHQTSCWQLRWDIWASGASRLRRKPSRASKIHNNRNTAEAVKVVVWQGGTVCRIQIDPGDSGLPVPSSVTVHVFTEQSQNRK